MSDTKKPSKPESSEPLTIEQRTKVEDEYSNRQTAAVIITMAICAVAVLMMPSLIRIYKTEHMIKGFVYLGAFFLCMAIILCFQLAKLHKLRKSLQQESEDGAMKRKIWVLPIGILVAVIVVLAGSIAYGVITQSIDYKYRQAQKLIDQGNFKQAYVDLVAFDDWDYKDTRGLISLCNAHREYDNGEVWKAHVFLQEARFKYQTPEQQKKIDEFKSKVEKDYNALLGDQEKEDAKVDAAHQEVEEEQSSSPKKPHKPYYPEVDEYTSPEDFYYNFPDYFMDYDEAEQYYYEHGGE